VGVGAREKAVNADGPAAEQAAPDAKNLELWVEREHPQIKNSLKSQLFLNGKHVGTFTTDARQPLGKYLKKGWNTLTLKTTGIAPPEEDRAGGLRFQVGWVSKAEKNREQMYVLWSLTNVQGWGVKDGKVVHRLGPDVKEIELPFHLNYQGMKSEKPKVAGGDIVLQAGVYNQDLTTNIRTTVTVFVNGQPLNTFTRQQRQVVITPLLKDGENEIKVVSRRINNIVFDTHNPRPIVVGGPAVYSPREQKYTLREILKIDGMSGWKEDRDSGQLVLNGDPAKDALERTYYFRNEKPGRAGK
jgi:hypothetical protein